MAEFKRSRLDKKSDDEITKRTLVLGFLTIVVFALMVVFGLPFLIKFSILLGEARIRASVEVKDKVLPPLAPRLILPFEATNSSQIEIKGLAEKNVNVELLKNDVSVGKIAANDAGEFTFGDITLDQGESVFTAIAIGDNGGSSEPSKELKVTFDNTPPDLLMINPSENSLKVDSPDFDIVGKSDKGASVLINGRVAMLDDQGKFKLKFQLNSGKNDIEIVVRDLAGNEIRKKIEITYDI
jgi:bacillopeptidase F